MKLFFKLCKKNILLGKLANKEFFVCFNNKTGGKYNFLKSVDLKNKTCTNMLYLKLIRSIEHFVLTTKIRVNRSNKLRIYLEYTAI